MLPHRLRVLALRVISRGVFPLPSRHSRNFAIGTVCCLGGDFHADVAEAGIIIEHFLLANAFQAQPSRFENAPCLNRDGMADAVEVIETHYSFADRHNRHFIIFALYSPTETSWSTPGHFGHGDQAPAVCMSISFRVG